jgi:hypothetical protein
MFDCQVSQRLPQGLKRGSMFLPAPGTPNKGFLPGCIQEPWIPEAP